MNMDFKDRIRDLRTQKKLSQTELGKLVDVHYTQISRYERGESSPSAEVLRKLAEVLEVSSDYLMEGSSEEAAKAHLQDKELLYQFKQVEGLGEEDKKVIKIFIDAFLTKRQVQRLAR